MQYIERVAGRAFPSVRNAECFPSLLLVLFPGALCSFDTTLGGRISLNYASLTHVRGPEGDLSGGASPMSSPIAVLLIHPFSLPVFRGDRRTQLYPQAALSGWVLGGRPCVFFSLRFLTAPLPPAILDRGLSDPG